MAEKMEEKLNKVSDKDAEEIVDTVNRESGDIHYSYKPTVIFCGEAQCGKSTLINCLKGYEFEEVEEEEGKVILKIKGKIENKDNSLEFTESNSKEKEQIAAMGTGLESKTVYPFRFSDNSLPFDLLDTRGYYDRSLKRNDNIAYSVMVDAYIRRNNKDILVFLCKYEKFKDLTFLDARDFVNGLSSRNIKLFFVINQYTNKSYKKMMELNSLEGDEFNKRMDEELKKDFMKLYNIQSEITMERINSYPEGKRLIELCNKFLKNLQKS